MLDSATATAQQVLADQRMFLIRSEAWDEFLAALDRPVTREPRLEALLRKKEPGLTGELSNIEKLAPHHDVSAFDCGQPELNEWLGRHALASARSDAAQTYVILDGDQVVGYYALAAGSVDRDEARGRVAKGMSTHPIPVLILARLGVDRSLQGRGIGTMLLRDALFRAASGAEIMVDLRAALRRTQ